jgi:MraZ protein
MFFGTYHNSIDGKGRCMIPAKLRGELGDECFVVPGMDRNILIYKADDYKRFLDEHVLNRPLEDPSARRLRDLYTQNMPVTIDRAGRVNLPQNLIDYAGIEKETVTTGNADHITIWSREIFDRERNPLNTDIGALFEDMLKYAGS